ncbi:hypothetical protein C8T65DRAFT_575219 [Cerioporus squamosus]|nr:hypothetical protein C8T65DRAFT_575219 [Cerioporus squamosus]
MDLKRTLYTLTEQLKAERQRADAAENKTREVLALFKSANEAKITAEQASARANEELRMYKLQYENAREELRRAQKIIDALESQRVDAEEAAAKARSMARRLKEEKIIMQAKEEGRRQGLEEGLAQGRVVGYEEGRAAGYERGRADTERAYTSAPVTEMDYETPRTRQYEPVHISRPSSSEESIPTANYTQTLDDNLPVPPPITSPARIPTPAAAPVRPPTRTPSQPEIRPIPVQNVLSPSHPPVDIPPDGWIPQIDDGRIRLPPPHEMAPPPPSPSPPLSAVLNNVKNIPEEPVMIPPPANSDPEPSRRPRHRRRNSTESQSTTMSQFEILGPPTPSVPTLRPHARERPNVLSAIAEERERSSSSSPVYGLPNLSTQSFQMPTPTPGMPVPIPPSPQNPPPPQNPSYPDTTPRYTRSRENLARSDEDYYSRSNTPRYGRDEGSYRSRSPGPENTYRTRSPGPENSYRSRSPGPESTTPRYEPPRERGAYDRYGGAESVPRGSTPASQYSVPRGGTPSVHRAPSVGASTVYSVPRGGTPTVQRAPSAGTPSVHRYSSRDNLSRAQNIYAPPHSPHSSPESPNPGIVAPAPSLRPPPPQHTPQNRGSMSSNEITFNVEPPSRPESNISRTEGAEPHRSFLSAEDADRPLPATPTEPDPSTQPPPVTSPVIPPPVMMSGSWGALPSGFVPTGPPSPIGSSISGPAGVPLPPSSYGGSTVGPAGVPLPPSVYGATPSVRSESGIPGGFPGGEGPPPVIPLQPSSRSSQSAGSSRNAKEPYTRSAIKRQDDDSDDSSVSTGLGSADSLTTPPARTRKLSTRSMGPAYAEAPVPANVQYPVPPTPRSSTSNSLGSYSNRAARVPLPTSVSGSTSGSAVGGPTARSSVFGGTRPPSEAGRPRSPLMGGGRNLYSPAAPAMSLPVPEPVIPIPIPEPTPITSPVVPASPYRRTTTPLADIEPSPVIPPPLARASSPVASAVSAATTTNTRGGKKKKKR